MAAHAHRSLPRPAQDALAARHRLIMAGRSVWRLVQNAQAESNAKPQLPGPNTYERPHTQVWHLDHNAGTKARVWNMARAAAEVRTGLERKLPLPQPAFHMSASAPSRVHAGARGPRAVRCRLGGASCAQR